MSDDLVAFLRERLADDERVATAAQPGPWTAYRSGGTGVMGADARGVADRRGFDPHARYETGEDLSVEDAAHIARHDPARVLAEVAAKRAILARLADTAPPYADSRQQEIHETLRDEVIPHLALPYAERPDYRQEWAP